MIAACQVTYHLGLLWLCHIEKKKAVGDSDPDNRMDQQFHEYLQSIGPCLDALTDQLVTLKTTMENNKTTFVGITTKVTTMDTKVRGLREASRAPNEYLDVSEGLDDRASVRTHVPRGLRRDHQEVNPLFHDHRDFDHDRDRPFHNGFDQ